MPDRNETRPLAPAPTTVLAFGRNQPARDLMAEHDDDTVPYTPIREQLTLLQRIAKWWRDYLETWSV